MPNTSDCYDLQDGEDLSAEIEACRKTLPKSLSHLYFSLKAQAVTSPAHHTRTKLACGRLIIAYRFDGAFYSGLFDEIGISAGTEMAGLRILPSTIDCRYRQVQLKEQQVWAAVLEQWEQV